MPDTRHRRPEWFSLLAVAFETFNQRGIPSIFLRYPDYIYADIFKSWCEQNDINFYKRKGKRTRKRIMRNFKRDMRHLSRLYHAGAITPHYYTEHHLINVKKMIKISNILDDFHNFQVDLTVTLLNGVQYNDVVVGNVRMHDVFSKIKNNANITDNAKFYIIDGINNQWFGNDDGSIYIDPNCGLVPLMTNCCSNLYKLNLGVVM